MWPRYTLGTVFLTSDRTLDALGALSKRLGLAHALVAARLGALVGLAFAFVSVARPTLGPWREVLARIAEGVALGAVTGAGIGLAQASLQWGRGAEPVSPRISRVAASLLTLWTGLATARGLRGGLLGEGLLTSEGSEVLAVVAALFLLVVGWRTLVFGLDRGSPAPPPAVESFVLGLLAAGLVRGGLGIRGRWSSLGSVRAASLSLVLVVATAAVGALALRLAARGRGSAPTPHEPLRRIKGVGWSLLGTATLAGLFLTPQRPPGDRSPRAPTEGGDQLAVFRTSRALRDHALVKLGSEVRAVLAAPCPSDFAYPIEDAHRVELAWGTGVPSGGVTAGFRALIKTADRQTQVLVDEAVTPAAAQDSTWFSRTVDLPADAKGGQLLLRTRGACRASFWAPPVFSRYPGPPRSTRNVVLVSLDTVRADHLNAYGYKRRQTSPEFDDWARNGTLFENAVSASPVTLSSQMSILTGRYPSSHGVSYAKYRLSGRIPVLPLDVSTLPELLRAPGFLTAAFTGSGYFAVPVGYSRGFGEFVSTDDATLGSAATVFEKGFTWMERHRNEPFFLFLHTYEAHEPYLDERFVYQEGLGFQDPRARNEALYDGDIRRADTYLGKLRRVLDQLDLASRTIVVVVADHGEEFGDHFPVWTDGHGHSLFEEQIHVPFLAVGPEIPRGRRISQAVDLTTVAPTILALLGVRRPKEMDGQDLQKLMRGETDGRDSVAFSEDVWIGPATRAARIRDWKLIEKGEELPERFVDRDLRRAILQQVTTLAPQMLFHLPRDPAERDNRLATDGDMATRLHDLLKGRLALSTHAGADADLEVEGETLERLRALGYVR
jgi:arylsulfatase A-like enzyme